MGEGKTRELPVDRSELEEETVFTAEEINIEEMAIDGICGVY